MGGVSTHSEAQKHPKVRRGEREGWKKHLQVPDAAVGLGGVHGRVGEAEEGVVAKLGLEEGVRVMEKDDVRVEPAVWVDVGTVWHAAHEHEAHVRRWQSRSGSGLN